MLSNKTAILIFARSVKEELRYKPFLAQNSLLHKLHRHTVSVAKRSGLSVIVYDETKQCGGNFGSRFTNAIENVFDAGYENVIAIGNDCPQLKIEHITQAARAIRNNKNAIGGTYDGGFYLLGISKERFDRTAFLNFNWHSDNLYKEVITSISSSTSTCKVLQKLRDVDSYSDLENLILNGISDSTLRNCIQSIVQRKSKKRSQKKLLASLFTSEIVSNRGSPLFCIG